MNRFAWFAFAIVFVQISLTETGLIKDVISNLSGTKKNKNPSQNYSPDPNYKNTTWFIENEDYLTPNTNTSTQSGHNRPNESHHNSGSSNRPNTDTSSQAVHHRPNTDTLSESSHYRPNGSHHNSGFSNRPNTDTSSESSHYRPNGSHHSSGSSNRPPNYGNFPSSPSSSSSWANNYERPFLENENQKDWTGEQLRAGELIQDHSKRETTSNADKLEKPVPYIPEETPVSEHISNTKTRNGEKYEESNDGNNIILTSDNFITCCYNNIKDEKIENRHLRCNETDCVLEKISEKSSLWICKNIKCNVANVDFTKKVENKKLIECAMDARNIITVQDKPISCGPNEREHNGRCRKVFGA